jgi:hypothetical protein
MTQSATNQNNVNTNYNSTELCVHFSSSIQLFSLQVNSLRHSSHNDCCYTSFYYIATESSHIHIPPLVVSPYGLDGATTLNELQ